jgi:arylsulfatase A-like enzyme
MIALSAALLILSTPAAALPAAAPTAKHLVLLVVDDLGFGDLGYTGSAVKTPVMDALATTGVILGNYYVMRACSPTRASLQTGRYVIRYGMNSGVIETGQAFGLDLGETLLPQALRKSAALLAAGAGAEPEAAPAATALSCDAAGFKKGWNCAGGGLPGDAPVAGSRATSEPGVCCSLCSANADCAVWTIYNSKCYLKTAACTMTKSDLSVSGGNASTPLGPPPPPSHPCGSRAPAPRPAAGSWATHAVGKWHLGFWQWASTPTFRGYDSYMGYYTGGEDYYLHGSRDLLDFRLDGCVQCGANCSAPQWDAVGKYSTHLFTERAQKVIEEHDPAQRLFLYQAYQAVHAPREVPASYLEQYTDMAEPRKTFAGMLSCLDEGVGNLTTSLKAKGLWDELVMFVTTDNGAPTPSCGGAQGGQNYPLRGGKCSAWEGGLHGTAFVHSQLFAASARGKRLGALMHAVDVLPTLVAAASGSHSVDLLHGYMAAAGRPLDGVSLWSQIAGVDSTPPRTELLMELDPHYCCQPGGDSRYCGDQHGSGVGSGYYALRQGDWKLLVGDPAGGLGDGWYCSGAPCTRVGWEPSPVNLTAGSVQLYNIANDPTEHHDQAKAQPAIVARLMAALDKYNATAEPSYVCGAPGPFKVGGALTPWCVAGGEQSGCTSPPPDHTLLP